MFSSNSHFSNIRENMYNYKLKITYNIIASSQEPKCDFFNPPYEIANFHESAKGYTRENIYVYSILSVICVSQICAKTCTVVQRKNICNIEAMIFKNANSIHVKLSILLNSRKFTVHAHKYKPNSNLVKCCSPPKSTQSTNNDIVKGEYTSK